MGLVIGTRWAKNIKNIIVRWFRLSRGRKKTWTAWYKANGFFAAESRLVKFHQFAHTNKVSGFRHLHALCGNIEPAKIRGAWIWTLHLRALKCLDASKWPDHNEGHEKAPTTGVDRVWFRRFSTLHLQNQLPHVVCEKFSKGSYQINLANLLLSTFLTPSPMWQS